MTRDDGEPTTGRSADDDKASLVAFVRDRDVACPDCGYNLRGLSTAVCPECRRELRLTVGLVEQRIGWLFLALAPCVFSGIAALILALPIVIAPIMNPNAGAAPPGIVAIDVFGWVSAFFGLALWLRRQPFLRERPGVQVRWAIGVWLIHVAAFGVLVLAVAAM